MVKAIAALTALALLFLGGLFLLRAWEEEAVMGEKYMEYYVDETAARELVMELFYEPALNA